MSNSGEGNSCSLRCWITAAVIGLITAILSQVLGHSGWGAAIFLGVLAFVLLGLLFNWLFCADVPKRGEGEVTGTRYGTLDSLDTGRSAVSANTSAPSSTSTSSSGGAAASAAAATAASAAAATASAAASEASATEAASDDDAGASVSDDAGDSGLKPSAALEGEAELAERKGEWKYDGDSADDGSAADAAPAEAADAVTSDESAAPSADNAAADSADDVSETVLKPSTALPGQEDLASRKGTWRYEGGDAKASGSEETASTAAETAEAEAESKKAVSLADHMAAQDDSDADRDGDGVVEGTDEGTKPQTLDAPIDGKADDLKKIKGVGPKLEKLCNALGFYHFDQIANWTDQEVAWVDSNLVGFRGRVTRDKWVEQAKLLSAGMETEFSKRVDKGGVY